MNIQVSIRQQSSDFSIQVGGSRIKDLMEFGGLKGIAGVDGFFGQL